MTAPWFYPLFDDGSPTREALQSIAEELGEVCDPRFLFEDVCKWCQELETVRNAGAVNMIRLSLVINELPLGDFQAWMMREGVEHYVTFLTQIYGSWMQYERRV